MSSLIPRPRKIEKPPPKTCPLPFALQDLCLLVLINDLDRYPVELLASMPLWLRNHLLNNIPVLDLCRLELTPVARNVDVNAIWAMRVKVQELKSWKPNWYPRCGMEAQSWGMMYRRIQSDFQVDIGLLQSNAYSHYDSAEDIKSAIQKLSEDTKPKQLYLFEIMSEILSTSSPADLKNVVHKLISIQGDLILSNLMAGKSSSSESIFEYDQKLWKQQVTALAVQGCMLLPHYKIRSGFSFEEYSLHPGTVQLTPHRLLSMITSPDQLQLLSFLARDQNLQPSSASVPISLISQSILPKLCAEKVASVTPASDEAPYTSILSHILGKVAVLRLQCDTYANIRILVRMIKAATADGNDSCLKHLFCVIPDVYTDVVQPFLSLYSLKNFCQLTIIVEPDREISMVNFSELLQGFMTTPCFSTQKLIICSREGVTSPDPQFEFFKCSNNEGSKLTKGDLVASCATEHKLLRFYPPMKSTNTLNLLLQAPTIQLKEIALVQLSQCYKYLHSFATHPNLQVQKLVIDIDLKTSVDTATAQRDMATLLTMHSLRKICIYGTKSSTTEINEGLLQGLHQRTKSHLPPLTKIALKSAEQYRKKDLNRLCDALFSLSQLENLKVMLGGKLVKMQGFDEAIYNSWVSNSSKVQLKSLTLQTHETKFAQVSLVTQNLTFAPENSGCEEYVYTIYI